MAGRILGVAREKRGRSKRRSRSTCSCPWMGLGRALDGSPAVLGRATRGGEEEVEEARSIPVEVGVGGGGGVSA